MKRLSRDNHIYVLDPAGGPAITIGSGEELMVETWDAFEVDLRVEPLCTVSDAGPLYLHSRLMQVIADAEPVLQKIRLTLWPR